MARFSNGTSVVTRAIGAVADAAEEVENNVVTTEGVGRDLGVVAFDPRHLVGAMR